MLTRSIFIWGPFLALILLGLIIMISLDSRNPAPSTQPASPATSVAENAQEVASSTAQASENTLENVTEAVSEGIENAQETTNNAATNVIETVNDGIAKIPSNEILNGVPPVDGGVALSTGKSIDLGQELQHAFNSISTALTSITDSTSAQAALPTLASATTSISNVATLAKFLSEDARAALENYAQASQANLQTALDAANHIEGVSSIVAPAVETLSVAIAQLSD